MAATEAKTAVKPEAKAPPEAKEAAVEENMEPPLKYKTWVLKVSIHCEGCKRKVKKILTNMEGVYKLDIDLRQQRVAVMGNIDSEALINKLMKAGRHAELWPERADQKEKMKGKAKNMDKDKQKQQQQQQQSDKESSEEGGGEKEKETEKTEVLQGQDPPKESDNVSTNKNNDVINAAVDGGAASKPAPAGQFKEDKIEVKQPTIVLPVDDQSPVAADKKVGGESEGGASGSSSSSSGVKKKKKKAHNGNSNNNGEENEHSNDTPASTGSPSHGASPGHGQGPAPYQASYSPPRHHAYQYPSHYYVPPAYAVHNNTAYPSSSYSVSYNAPRYSYAYVHPGVASEPPPVDFDSFSSQPSDSFEMFSDENPNACSVM